MTLLTAALIIAAIAIAVGLVARLTTGVRVSLGSRGPVYVEQRRPRRRDAR